MREEMIMRIVGLRATNRLYSDEELISNEIEVVVEKGTYCGSLSFISRDRDLRVGDKMRVTIERIEEDEC